MTFKSATTHGNHCCFWIAAEGEITSDTPRAFEEFMNHMPYRPPVRLHSPGGSLIAGIKLGYLFRKYGMSTEVGRTISRANYDGMEDGYCASACAYAFLGGVQRTLGQGARLGFHRFYKGSAAENLATPQYSGQDLDETQRVFAALVLYIRAMGVDPGLVGLADQAAPNQIHWVTQAEAERLRLTNNLLLWSAWKIEPYGAGVIAYSERADSKSKMTLYCSRRQGYLLLSEKGLEYQFADQYAKCGPNGAHPVLGSWVSNKDTSVVTQSDGSAAILFRLPQAVPFSSAALFRFMDGYPMVCDARGGWDGTTENLVQSARVALRDCID